MHKLRYPPIIFAPKMKKLVLSSTGSAESHEGVIDSFVQRSHVTLARDATVRAPPHP
jgi:hypothetical protein